MSQFERNHYVQNRLLKNFSIKSKNGKDKICVIDLIDFDVYYRNTESAFYEKNLYDVVFENDNKELEHKFKEKIEDPMCNIFDKCKGTNMHSLTLTRVDLEIIKKYILLQLYRTPKDRKSYTNLPNNTFELSQFNIEKNEDKVDFWKREMLTILDSDWDSLITTDMIGIRKHVLEINSSFLMFVHTNDEFCINDLGYCTERIPMKIPEDMIDDYIKAAKKLGQELYGQDNFDEVARKEIANQSSYIDNFVLFPVTSHLAILSVSLLWKQLLLNPELKNSKFPYYSPILQQYLSIPMTNYVDENKIKSDADIIAFKSPKDQYIYTIHNITNTDTIYLNHLTINEAFCYIGLKTPTKFLDTIREYNILASNQTANIKKNLLGYIEKLNKIIVN